MSDVKKPTPSEIDRRAFITKLALAAAVPPAMATARLFAAPGQAAPRTPTNVRIVQKKVLTAADFTYLGAMRVPSAGVNLQFASGALTGRRVNGRVHLFVTQNLTHTPAYKIAEILDTEIYNSNGLVAPQATLATDWGDVYQGKRISWYDNALQGHTRGEPMDLNPAAKAGVGGLLYVDNPPRLYWQYNGWYNVAGNHDWHLGMTLLNDGPGTMQAYGPWRADVNAGSVFKLGQHICLEPGGAAALGAALSSGNIQSSFGPCLKGGVTLPTAATPSGWGKPDLAVPRPYVEFFNTLSDLSLGELKAGRTLGSMPRSGDYVWHLVSSSSRQNDASASYLDPTKASNGGQGSWTDVDKIDGSIWIDLPTKSGVLFVGALSNGHTWYGLSSDCGHGFASCRLAPGTGPNTNSFKAWWGIYDPARLAQIANGTLDSKQLPDVQFDPTTAIGPMTLGPSKTFGGMYFDVSTSKLYVLAKDADRAGLSYLPLIHVFQVAG